MTSRRHHSRRVRRRVPDDADSEDRVDPNRDLTAHEPRRAEAPPGPIAPARDQLTLEQMQNLCSGDVADRSEANVRGKKKWFLGQIRKQFQRDINSWAQEINSRRPPPRPLRTPHFDMSGSTFFTHGASLAELSLNDTVDHMPETTVDHVDSDDEEVPPRPKPPRAGNTIRFSGPDQVINSQTLTGDLEPIVSAAAKEEEEAGSKGAAQPAAVVSTGEGEDRRPRSPALQDESPAAWSDEEPPQPKAPQAHRGSRKWQLHRGLPSSTGNAHCGVTLHWTIITEANLKGLGWFGKTFKYASKKPVIVPRSEN